MPMIKIEDRRVFAILSVLFRGKDYPPFAGWSLDTDGNLMASDGDIIFRTFVGAPLIEKNLYFEPFNVDDWNKIKQITIAEQEIYAAHVIYTDLTPSRRHHKDKLLELEEKIVLIPPYQRLLVEGLNKKSPSTFRGNWSRMGMINRALRSLDENRKNVEVKLRGEWLEYEEGEISIYFPVV